ncbi:MAG: lipoate--protein ligase [Bacteroidales bacterium]|nr:lipoate--protein ligase [Bacteroidales bacterium]
MLLIKSESTDAYFNIALEEYLINNYDEEFFIIAVNEPSIIVGSNQYTYDEINALYVKQNNVKVVRRLSGGGTVFQDHGNINFSHIYFDDGSKLNDFSKVCDIILNFVNSKMGIDAKFAGRNDLVIDDKKFSGHARLRLNGKILHHGTLLFSSNMTSLTDSLKFNPEKYADRSLRSNHQRVTNLVEHLPQSISLEKTYDMFWNYLRSIFPESKVYVLNHEDVDNVKKLVADKYSTWDWNYGSEVNLPLFNTAAHKYGNFEIYLESDNNKIKQIRIFGDFFSKENMADIENALIGCEINASAAKNALKNLDFNNYMSGISLEEFVAIFNVD